MAINLPERCYCADVDYPMAIVGTAGRRLIVYSLENNPSEYKQMESPLKFQHRAVSIFRDKQKKPIGFALGSIEGRVAIQYVSGLTNLFSFYYIIWVESLKQQRKLKTHLFQTRWMQRIPKITSRSNAIASMETTIFRIFMLWMTSNSIRCMAHWWRLARTVHSVSGTKMRAPNSSRPNRWTNQSPNAVSVHAAIFSLMPWVTTGAKAMNTTIHRKRRTFSCARASKNWNQDKVNPKWTHFFWLFSFPLNDCVSFDCFSICTKKKHIFMSINLNWHRK